MRKIKDELIERMTNGDLLPLLNYLKSDDDLRLEVRQNGEAFIYYRKRKVLEIGALKIDENYGNVPSTDLAVSDPNKYFELIKEAINIWPNIKKDRAEFDTQQDVARCNQEINDKYIIIDMEYNFSQSGIHKSKREKQAGFDLLGIERSSGKIILFEVKKGLLALSDPQGIKAHIVDFENFIHGTKKDKTVRDHFRGILVKDIENIVADKIKLGLICNFSIPVAFSKDPKFDFIFVYESESYNDKEEYDRIFKQECKSPIFPKEYKTIYVSKGNNYKLE